MRPRLAALILGLGCGVGTAVAAGAADDATKAAVQSPGDPSPAGALAPVDIHRAVERLKAEADLGGPYTTRRLEWVTGKVAAPPAGTPPWITRLVEGFARAASVLVWVIVGASLIIASVLLYTRRDRRPRATPLPLTETRSSIGELDVTPGSLPSDIAGTALALIQDGKRRDGLSLLYRGALSRAVHEFGIEIRRSATEREAVQAVRVALDAARADYISELVELWQTGVYAGRFAADDVLASACRRFASTLERPVR